MTLSIEQGAALATRLRDSVATRVVGQDRAIEDALVTFLARGHLLIEGVPGTAKTLLVRALASALGLRFTRIQFTPDLMPSDVTGVSMLRDPARGFEFQPGPVFTDILLGDEINRAPAKTQSALLEAMGERQVTVDGVSRALDPLFTVYATQNPIEHEGTYPLPEAQLDRFLLRISVGYPEREDEFGILELRRDRRTDEVELAQVVGASELREMQRALEDVHVAESIGWYIVDVVRATREGGAVQVGASPRGTLAVLKLARARAALDGRDFVVP